jgi:hypothetical protein
MRPRTVMVLALVVLGLGAYLWFFEQDRPTAQESRDAARRLWPWEPGAVTAVEVTGPDGARLRLERQPAPDRAVGDDPGDPGDGGATHWRLVAPLAATADARSVEDLVGALVELRWYREETGVDAAALGLVPPRFRVVVETAQEQRALRFGNALPATDRVVVAPEPERSAGPAGPDGADGAGGASTATVYVVDDLLIQQFQRPVDAWRARDLLPGSRYQVERVRLAGASPIGVPPVHFQRLGAGEIFEVSGGTLAAPDRADAVRIGELLGELETLRVVTFEDGADPAALGLAPPAATVEVWFQGQEEPFLLELGDLTADGDGVYGRSGALVFTLNTALLPLARLPVEAWRSLALTTLSPFDIALLDLRDDRGEWVLRHAEGVWTRDGEALRGTAPADLVDLLTEARARRLLQAEEAVGLAPAFLTIRLEARAERESEPQTLSFHALPENPAAMAVRCSGRDVVLLWDEAASTELATRIQALRSAAPKTANDG